MSTIEAIKQAARDRAHLAKLAYAGALVPREAFALMQAGVRLVDVRTQAERDWVGRVPGALPVEWNGYPGAKLNSNFLADLEELVAKDEPVMFLCRSGQRSHYAAAAATAAGWRECYNVVEGFEGDKDAHHHRNSTGGWRVAGLPWIQS